MIAVAGGTGSPGRTTLAINLAVALGAIVPTVLVDVDCCSPTVSAYLNRDPSRNVCTLAHAVRDDPHGWPYGLQEELQPLHPRSPYGRVLCGLPRRETRASLTPAVMEQLLVPVAADAIATSSSTSAPSSWAPMPRRPAIAPHWRTLSTCCW